MKTFPEIEALLCLAFFAIASLLALYAVIRRAVRDGISDALKSDRQPEHGTVD